MHKVKDFVQERYQKIFSKDVKTKKYNKYSKTYA